MQNHTTENASATSKSALWAVLGVAAIAAAKAIYSEITKYDLREKVVLITGGSRGLGLAMARELGKTGCRLVICARNPEQLEKAREELAADGIEVITIQADLTVQNEAKSAVEAAVNRFGQLDVVINNAGVMIVGPENTMDIDDFKKVVDANLWSALYMIKAAIPQFKKQGEGRIVNICSIGGKIAVPHMLPYSVSKFAMVGLSEGIGAELKKDNIHVTTVIPNLMRTGSPRNVSVKGDHAAEYAWFKFSASAPLLSQNADKAAKEIISGLQHRKSHVILTFTAKVAIALQGIMPGTVSSVMEIANRYLPDSDNKMTKTGAESESELSQGIVAERSDEAAIKYNE